MIQSPRYPDGRSRATLRRCANEATGSVMCYPVTMRPRGLPHTLENDTVETPGPLSTPCRLWRWSTRAGTTDNYGALWVAGSRRIVLPHRYFYEQAKGPIPPGMQIDHLCRVTLCCEPSHLEAVTNRENAMRGSSFSAVNARKEACLRGHEFTPENTYKWRGKFRQCRACVRELQRVRRARRPGPKPLRRRDRRPHLL